MNKFFSLLILSIGLMLFQNGLAKCKNVYTIGAYDEAFKNHKMVLKLGPLPASDVPPILPKSFLEKDGSYAGGEAFCSIETACEAFRYQIKTGVLPKAATWHIYMLDADWNHDTYLLHPNDYRLKHSAKVLKLVHEKC